MVICSILNIFVYSGVPHGFKLNQELFANHWKETAVGREMISWNAFLADEIYICLAKSSVSFSRLAPDISSIWKYTKRKSRDYVSGIWELIKISVNATSLSHYLHTDILNTLRQNDRHFADVFKCIFFDRSVWLSIKMPLKFLPKGPINNKPILVQTMASHRTIIWTNDGLI